MLFVPPCFFLVAMKLKDNGNPEFPRLMIWFHGTGIPGIEFYTYCPVLVNLLTQICIFGSGDMRFLKLNLYCSGCSGESQYTKYSEADLLCYPKHISGKGFSAAWQFLLKMSRIFITETSGLDIGVECPTSHPATGMGAWPVCQPGWPLFLDNDGWDSFPSQFMVPGSSTFSRAVSR